MAYLVGRAASPRFVMVAAVLWLTGARCEPQSDLPCFEDEQCAERGEGGRCEPEGFCTFSDADCPSARRWHDRAPSSLAGTCWEPAQETTATGTDTGGPMTDTEAIDSWETTSDSGFK